MPYIKVNTNKIQFYATELEVCCAELRRIQQEFVSKGVRLDWDVRSDATVRRRVDQLSEELSVEVNSIVRMKRFLNTAAKVYNEDAIIDLKNVIEGNGIHSDSVILKTDNGDFQTQAKDSKSVNDIVLEGFGITQKIVAVGGVVVDAIDYYKNLHEAADKAKRITYTLKQGKMYLKGYKRTEGLTSRYNFSTWLKKGANDGMKFNVLDKIAIGIDVAEESINMGTNLYKTWTDENKSTEKKLCDTYANVYCSAASVALNVGGVILGKAASGAVSAACCAIPVIGPVVGCVAGAATSAVVGSAVGIIADTMTSEAVVNQVSDAVENVVGATKAGVKVVSDAAKKIAEADTIGEKVVKTAELIGAGVVETTKVAVTTAVEGIKTGVTLVGETVKNVGKTVANLFKGW